MARSMTTAAGLALLLSVAVLATAAAAAASANNNDWQPESIWQQGERAAPDAQVRLQVGLKVDTVALDEAAWLTTEGLAPYYSMEQLRAAIAPSAAVREKVAGFFKLQLAAHHMVLSNSWDVLEVYTTAAAVEKAFNTQLFSWTHKFSGRTTLRAGARVALPAAIADYVDVVLGLTDFFVSKQEQALTANTIATQARVAAGMNEPYIAAINGNATTASVVFEVYCKNGAPSQDPKDLCGDVAGQPGVKSFSLLVHPDGEEAFTIVAPADSLQCASVSVRAAATCTLDATVPAYRATRLTLTTNYADGSSSTPYPYPSVFVPRPLMTTEKLGHVMNIPTKYRRGTNPMASQAITSFEKQYYSLDDLHKFFETMDLPYQAPHLVGYNDGTVPGGEATLDVQWIMGTGQGINTTTWSFPTGDYILNWAWAVGNHSVSPLVTSISYGDTETGYEFKTGYGLIYITRMNIELQKMAVRGFTVFAGSGDAGWTNVGEAGNDLSHTDPTCGIMRAFYPSLSPWVVSTSAVFLSSPDTESAVCVSCGREWTTGGGFSNHTGVQDWQREAVAGYLANNAQLLPPSSMWNQTGRGYPDISALGDNILCIWNGVQFPLAGTSASGPIAAGFFSLINDARLNLGMPPLGHLNSHIYKWAKAYPNSFVDVTEGTNNDGDVQMPGSVYPTFCPHGFPAATGWDAATGLGTPSFADILIPATTPGM